LSTEWRGPGSLRLMNWIFVATTKISNIC